MNKILFDLFLLFMCSLISLSIAAQTIPPQGFFLDEWQPKSISVTEYETIAKPTGTATATVRVDANVILSKISKNIYGHNAGVWGGKLDQDAQLVKDLNALQPNVIRFPGGNMSNDYFWNASSQATCPADLPAGFVFKDQWYGANDKIWTMSLNSYYSLLEKTNSKGIICVNYAYARYGTSADPVLTAAKYAADWVRYDNGRTKYWEIGNENYGDWETGFIIDQTQNKDGQPKQITGDLYGRHAKVFIDEMRKAAKEVGNDIKIGLVVFDQEGVNNWAAKDWNKGVMTQAAAKADFFAVHNYYAKKTDTDVLTILNTATETAPIKTLLATQAKTYANIDNMPVALTEYNFWPEGLMQQVSYINGLHTCLVMGEAMKNSFGLGCRWDFVNGWTNGDSHGLFAGGEPNITKNTPRAPFYYMYYFQKYFGDRLIQSTVTGNANLVSYASKFSSGQSGIVLINKAATEQTVNVFMNNFAVGTHYYYYLLTGGTDNGNYSRKVKINADTTMLEGGGPSNYQTIKPYRVDYNGSIKLKIPKWGVVYLLVENDNNLLTQTINFSALTGKKVGDANFDITATASSGLPVTFSVSNSKVAVISNNTVKIIGSGTCTITASQDGNSTYLPAAQVSQTLNVSPATGIKSIIANHDFDVFPTLTSNYLKISKLQPGSVLHVFNMSGIKLISKVITTNECELNMREICGSGLFFIKVNDTIKKVIVL